MYVLFCQSLAPEHKTIEHALVEILEHHFIVK